MLRVDLYAVVLLLCMFDIQNILYIQAYQSSVCEMADKPQNASLHPEHNPKSFSNILTAVIILIGIGVTVISIYVGERQNTEDLRKELMNLKSQIGT